MSSTALELKPTTTRNRPATRPDRAGRSAAIAQLGTWKFRGKVAWLMWLFIHLIQIVRFENRLMVLIQWAWNYFTFNRSARLITDVGRTPKNQADGT